MMRLSSHRSKLLSLPSQHKPNSFRPFTKRPPRAFFKLSRTAFVATLICIYLLTSELSYITILSHLRISRLFIPTHRLFCRHPQKLAGLHAGWQLCVPHRLSIQNALIYTVGVGRNIQWDKQMIASYNTQHHGWDPTPIALDFFRRNPPPRAFNFHRIGLGPYDGNLTLKLPYGNHYSYTVMAHPNAPQRGTVTEVPVLTLSSMLKRFNHAHLAVLKIDIEGAEFDVIDQWAAANYRVPADQILIEFHESYFAKRPGYRNLVPNAVQKMAALGFKLIVKTNLEYTFARMDAIADDYAD